MDLLKKFTGKISEKIAVPFATYLSSTFIGYAPNYDNMSHHITKNPFFMAPLNEISRCFNNATIGVYKKNRKGDLELVKNSKVLNWLEAPNPSLTQDQYQTYWVLWYYLAGGLLMYKTPGVTKRQLFLYRPDTFYIKRDAKNMQINGIQIGKTTFKGRELDRYRVVRAVNLDDPIAGLGNTFESPLKSLTLMGDMTEFAFTHQNRQLKNSGKRTGILEYKKLLDKRKKEEIKEEFEGMGNKDAGRIAMLNGEQFKFHPTDITPQEMDWLQSVKFLREVIAATIGVPIQLISSEGTTYNNVREFKKKIYSDVIDPLLELYCNAHTAFFKEDLQEGEFIWFDTTNVKELQADVTNIVKDLATGLFGKGVTLNEFRQIVMSMTGLELKTIPGEEGNKILVPGNLSTVEDLLIDDTGSGDTETE